ncbi:MAG: response regulator [Deltaproteobacteria bacterium]|nr:response regulator [Deltaproteobacteria bacterium]
MAAKQTKKRILIADADQDVLKKLGAALEAAGFEVLLAKDGSKALECSILKTPDIVLIDRNCPLIDAQRFSSILRANPRTENTPMVVLTDQPEESDAGAPHSYLEGSITKPFNLDEVVARISGIAKKIETAESVTQEDRAIVGNLAQISLVDLLQIFSMNRKTGVLALKTSKQNGEIGVSEGRLVDAKFGRATGTKALYRMLKEKAGEFGFAPGKATKDVTLQGAVDSLIMEGMRQEDELDRLMTSLPALDDVIERIPGEKAEDLHPLMRTVLEALVEPRQVYDLFDAVPVPDFEVAQALQHLITARLARQRATKDGATGNFEPVLPEALVFMLRSYLHRALPGSVDMRRPRVLVVADDPRRVVKFWSGLQGITEFQKADASGSMKYGYGMMGSLPVATDLAMDLVALPMRMDLLPASVPLTLGALGIICLSSGAEDSTGLEKFREAMEGRLSVPWLEVTVDPSQADVTFEGEPRAVRGILAAFCRALGKS